MPTGNSDPNYGDSKPPSGRRLRVRSSQRAADRKRNAPSPVKPITRGQEGGQFAPLGSSELTQIDSAIRTLLAEIGFSEAPAEMIEVVEGRGGKLTNKGRLTFSHTMIDDALAGFQRSFILHGQAPAHDLHLASKHVFVGTGGAAPHMVDLETGAYRDSTLKDLYDAARLVDRLENIHFLSRPLVARDMHTDQMLDVNTAYACLAGTTKHVCTSITMPETVSQIAELCFAIAGSQAAFIERPFLSLNINHVVPPMRFAPEACLVMAEAARLGIPVHCNSFGQLGASSPVTLAGSVVQNVAEVLAGMIFAWLINPEVKAIFGARPMITDLRTGSMSGGSGEQAKVMAATTQVAHYYDLANSCIAGATDSKIPDAQSGYEKGLTVTLAAQAGANMITQACGTHASLTSSAMESYVIDNDMLGTILRSLQPIEVTEEALGVEMVREVISGEGHFLGHPETFRRMQSDFLYPDVADRRAHEEWERDGGVDIRGLAKVKARTILSSHFPSHLSGELDERLREKFDICLTKSDMQPLAL